MNIESSECIAEVAEGRVCIKEIRPDGVLCDLLLDGDLEIYELFLPRGLFPDEIAVEGYFKLEGEVFGDEGLNSDGMKIRAWTEEELRQEEADSQKLREDSLAWAEGISSVRERTAALDLPEA